MLHVSHQGLHELACNPGGTEHEIHEALHGLACILAGGQHDIREGRRDSHEGRHGLAGISGETEHGIHISNFHEGHGSAVSDDSWIEPHE